MHMPEQQQFALYPWKREEQRRYQHQQQQQQQQQQQHQHRQIRQHPQMQDNNFKTFGLPTFLQYPLKRQHNPLFAAAFVHQTSTPSTTRSRIKTETMQSLASNTAMPSTTGSNMKGEIDAATAVVVNSLIYAKPSFCGIVMAVGSSSITSGCFKQHYCQQQQQSRQNAAPTAATGKEEPPAFSFGGSSSAANSSFSSSSTTNPFGCGYGGNLSYLLNGLKINDPSSLFAKDKQKKDNDAELYMMCTTLNGSINHHISEFCENLLATMLLLDGNDSDEANSSHGTAKTDGKDKAEQDNKDDNRDESGEELSEDGEEEETDTETASEMESETETESETDTEDNGTDEGTEVVDNSDNDSLIEFSYNDEGDNQEDDIWSEVSDESSDDDVEDEKEDLDNDCTYANPANTEPIMSSDLLSLEGSRNDGVEKSPKALVIEHQMSCFLRETTPIQFQYFTSFTTRDHVDEVDFIGGSATYFKKQSYNCDKSQRTVKFNMKPVVHVMYTWNYAYRAARKGHWETFVRDRERFKLRIQRTAVCLEPVLRKAHRQYIFETRFKKLLLMEDEQVKRQAVQQQEQMGSEHQETRNPSSTLQPKDNAKDLIETTATTTTIFKATNEENAAMQLAKAGARDLPLPRAGPRLRCDTMTRQNVPPDDLSPLPSKIDNSGSSVQRRRQREQPVQHRQQQQAMNPSSSEAKGSCRLRSRKRALIYYCNAF